MKLHIGGKDKKVYEDQKFINWVKIWEKRVLMNNNLKEKSLDLMRNTNPTVIPRNHKVEEALNAANEDNFEVMNKLLNILNKPYRNQKNIENYQSLSADKEYQTFCGT